jgi:hypothetical protein
MFGVLYLTDTALTTAILKAGGRELNPIYGENPNLIYLWIIRFALLGFLCWATLRLASRRFKVPLILACVLTALSAFGVCWNSVVLLGL